MGARYRNPTTRFPLWWVVFYLLLWALTVGVWLMDLFSPLSR